MIDLRSRMAGAAALATSLSLLATPVQALDLPRAAAAPVALHNGQADGIGEADYYGRRYHRRGRGPSAGDILAGVLVIGTIAAIASSSSRSSRRDVRYDDRYRQPPPPQQQRDYRSNRGIDGAVDLCVAQVERGPDRVGSVDEASRRADGWHVGGIMRDGESFQCWIDNDGRLRSLDFGMDYRSSHAGQAGPDVQYGDDYYARARAGLDQAGAYQADPGSSWQDGGIDGDLGG